MFYILFMFLMMFLSMFTYSGGIFWAYFLMMTMFFCLLMKIYNIEVVIIYNYAVFQEILGYIYLLSFFSWMPLFVILMKLGISPLHMWVIIMADYLYGLSLIWLLIYHKMSFSPILVSLSSEKMMNLLWLGLLVIQLQILVISSFKILFVLLTQESMSWMLLILSFSLMMFWYMFIMYVCMMLIGMNSMLEYSYMELSFILIMMSYPVFFSFFIKYIALVFITGYVSLMYLMPLMFTTLSIMSSSLLLFSFIMMVEISASNIMVYSFMLFPLVLLILL